MVKTVLSPESAARELRERSEAASATGVLFGPERSGLDNDVDCARRRYRHRAGQSGVRLAQPAAGGAAVGL